LHVPPAEALTTAERLLNAKFVSPLGGTYEVSRTASSERWVATALIDNPNGNQPPADYQFPALNWLRGVDLELSLQKAPLPALAMHAEFIMPVETRAAPKFQLPKLPFGLSKPSALAPADTKPKEATPKATPKPPRPNSPKTSKPRVF
jgi:hypothetical protein